MSWVLTPSAHIAQAYVTIAERLTAAGSGELLDDLQSPEVAAQVLERLRVLRQG